MSPVIVKRWEALVTANDPTALQSALLGCLKLAAAIFTAVTRLRNWGYRERVLSVRRVRVPVVSIGNLSLGGTGKTQVVIWCAARLKEMGKTAVILSRGYGRRKRTEESCLVTDGHKILADTDESGDEPALMARQLKGVPIIVGADRAQTAQWAMERFSPDLLLLDDGFQHRGIERDLDAVCMDDKMLEAPRIFPAGFLREPAEALSRAQFVLLKTRNEDIYQAQFRKIFGFFPEKSTAAFTYHPESLLDHATGNSVPISTLSKRPVYAFSGIANPKDFERILKDSGADMAALKVFPDHHRFNPREMDGMVNAARERNAMLVTTEKDRMRIPKGVPVWSVQVSVRWTRGEEEFFKKILSAIKA